MPAMPVSQIRPALETAMTQADRHRAPAADAVDEAADDEHQPVHADDVER